MALNLNNVQTFSDSDLLALYRNAMAQLAISEEVTINGRTIRRSSLPEIINAINWLEMRIQDANAAPGGNVALVQFGNPSGTGGPLLPNAPQ